MSFLAQLGFILLVVGGLTWVVSRTNARLRRGDPVWQRTQRSIQAIGKAMLAVGGVLMAASIVIGAIGLLV